MTSRFALAASLALLPFAAAANGFAGFYAPAAGGRAMAVAAPVPAGLAIPGLGEVTAGYRVRGMDTLIPGLGDRAIQSVASVSGPASSCVSAIRRAEAKYDIPDSMLMAIGLQESGTRKNGELTVWPWSVNSHGKGASFETREEAMEFVRKEKAAGKTLIDVGCMQVNLRWHPDAFPSLREAFDPDLNADYAARFLSGLRASKGDWMAAAGNYHSATPAHQERYLAGIRGHMQAARSMGDGGGDAAFDPGVATAALAPSSVTPMRTPALSGRSFASRRGFMRQAAAAPDTAVPAPAVAAREISAPVTPESRAWGAGSIYSRRAGSGS